MELLLLIAGFVAIVSVNYFVFLAVGSRIRLRKRMDEPEKAPVAVLRREEAASPLKKRIMDWLSFSGQWGVKNQEEVSKIRFI